MTVEGTETQGMRVRVTFSKTGALRYIGHLDLQTLWERTVRRAGLPIAYSHGFHPQAKIAFASALPLGFASRAEVVDIRLQAQVDLAALLQKLQAALPSGITVLDVQSVDASEPALQMQVRSAEYEVTLLGEGSLPGIEQRIRRLLDASELPRVRREKPYDLRPLIEALELIAGQAKVFMRLAAREGATGRPEEVLDELGVATNSTHIERTRLIFQR